MPPYRLWSWSAALPIVSLTKNPITLFPSIQFPTNGGLLSTFLGASHFGKPVNHPLLHQNNIAMLPRYIAVLKTRDLCSGVSLKLWIYTKQCVPSNLCVPFCAEPVHPKKNVNCATKYDIKRREHRVRDFPTKNRTSKICVYIEGKHVGYKILLNKHKYLPCFNATVHEPVEGLKKNRRRRTPRVRRRPCPR